MKTRTFPERVERFGVCASIYAPKHKDKGFTVAYHIRGRLVRKVRNSYEDAKQLAQSVVEQKGNGELDALTLTIHDCLVYQRAVAAVKRESCRRHSAMRGASIAAVSPVRAAQIISRC